MKLTFRIDNHYYVATTEHAASSHGQPVLLVDGELTDIPVYHEADAADVPTALDTLADAADVSDGPATRRRLAGLADTMLADTDTPRGVDYDRVIDAFFAEGKRLEEAE